MKIIKTFFLTIAIVMLHSCSSDQDSLIENTDLQLKKDEFLKSKSYLFKNINEDEVSIFKNSIEFDEKGNLSTFRYDILKSNLNEEEFKNLLIEFYKSENVNKIVFLNSNGSQEVLLDSVSNFAKNGNNDELMREDVYLFDNKKNYRRGGCRPKSGWICEIRVNKSDTVFV